MRRPDFRAMFLALLVAVLLGGLASTTALAGATGQEICEGNGGQWNGGNASTGLCIYSFTNPQSTSTCPANQALLVTFTADSPTGQICGVPLNPQVEFTSFSCFLVDGEFAQNGTDATCTVSHDFYGDCSGSTIYYGTIVLSNFSTTHYECVGGGGGNSQTIRNPGFGKYGGKIKTDSAGSAFLGGNKNGSFNYDAGTCSLGCIYSPSLPSGAANNLPAGTLATFYVRLAEDGDGTYTVCFDVTGIANPVIYRYISGAWVPQAIALTGGQACTSASGDGAFALGG